jgi:superfamily II DNA or RNA helicase
MKRFFSANTARGVIQAALDDATTVRIATAYFEVSGYAALAPVLAGKEIRLLIGRAERGPDRVKEVIREFFASIESYDGADRIELLSSLRRALAGGSFFLGVDRTGEETVLEPRYHYLHAKCYIADRRAAVITSANMTRPGLVTSIEAGYTVSDANDVGFFVERFDELFDNAEAIGDELLELLEQYLELQHPFTVYARSLLKLYDVEDYAQPGTLPELADYQRPIVSRLVRAMEDYHGAMLVASTGLGKTVIGGHLMAYLRMTGAIDSAVILCPAGLKSMWRDYIRRARVSGDVFSYYILSIEDWRKYRDIVVLEKELANADAKTLVILDESHHLRNSQDGTDLRVRNRRVIDAVGRSARILLMTATPYSKDVRDINAQLQLLPRRRGDDSLYAAHDGNHADEHWEVSVPGELSDTPPCTVLTTPSVVRHYSYRDDDDNRYVVFSGGEKRYFPHAIAMRTVPYHNPVDGHLAELLDTDLLHLEEKNRDQEGLFGDVYAGRRDALLEARVVHQGCSSIGEFRRLAGQLGRINGAGYEKLRFQHQERLSVWAESVLVSISGDAPVDPKINALAEIIARHCSRREKIVVFCHYVETARYVTERIASLTGAAVETNAGKDPDDVDDIIDRFAPESNLLTRGDVSAEFIDELKPIDVLVATGALAEGFNFQDACVLVNFDLPWTVLSLAQRMGRILRPWKTPRVISVYTLMPSTMSDARILHARNWKRRLDTQNTEMKSFLEIPAMVDRDEQEAIVELASLARSLAVFGEETVGLNEVLEFIRSAERIETNSFVDDLASITPDERRHILRLPAGVRSVRSRNGISGNRLYVLIRRGNRLFPALFDEKGSVVRDHLQTDRIMELIRCERSEAPAANPMTLEFIDEWTGRAMATWARNYQFDIRELSCDCVMALLPQ